MSVTIVTAPVASQAASKKQLRPNGVISRVSVKSLPGRGAGADCATLFVESETGEDESQSFSQLLGVGVWFADNSGSQRFTWYQ